MPCASMKLLITYFISHLDTDSVFKLGWSNPEPEWGNPQSARDLMPVFDMRREVGDKIGLESPVEFDIFIHSSPKLYALLKVTFAFIIFFLSWGSN